MNSYKDLSKQQVKVIQSLGKYDVLLKQIAARVGATYNQVYNWYKKNGRSIIPSDQLTGANKSHYTMLMKGVTNRTDKKVSIAAKSDVKFVIPANTNYTLKSNKDGSVSLIY